MGVNQATALPLVTGQKDQLNAIRTLMATAQVHLYLSAFQPNQNSVLSGFLANEASFDGYVPVSLTWSVVGVDANNNAVIVSSRALFLASDANIVQSIGGAWVDSGTSSSSGGVQVDTGTPELYVPFVQPIQIAFAGNFIAITVTMTLPAGPGYASVEN